MVLGKSVGAVGRLGGKWRHLAVRFWVACEAKASHGWTDRWITAEGEKSEIKIGSLLTPWGAAIVGRSVVVCALRLQERAPCRVYIGKHPA